MFKVEAIDREADPTPWEFEFDGDVYRLPSDVDMRVLAAMEGGRLDDALKLLLGPAQWQRMNESTCIFGATQLQALMEAYMNDLGLDLGKPSPSTESSATTGTPLKRTSKGTTR